MLRRLRLKHARRRFTAARDEHGVPHITADSLRGALYGLGFMHAVDRPTQMYFSRTVASGQSAELIADRPELVETDRFFRRAGLYRNLDEEVRSLDDHHFGHVTAYCEGVNDGIKQSGRTLPMRATGFHPSPWDQKSVLLIGALLSYGGLVIGQQQNERLILELIQSGVEPAQLRELFSPLLDDADFDLLRRVKITSQLSDDALELLADLPRLAGSNAWAVSPQRSASGKALLCSDPHLEINRLPAIWYEAVLRWDDHYVMGATLPGCPLVAVARTKELSWGVTYLKGDTSDYFIEDCRRTDSGWQYRRGELWHNFQVREESIGRKGHAPELLRVYENPQGTVEQDLAGSDDGLHLSLAWIGSHVGTGSAIGTWLDLIECTRARPAMDIVRKCPHPTLCWVFADSEGHIGMQASGWFPHRGGHHTGILPIPAWDAANHWQGRLPSDVLPSIYDPPEGFVATANENINAISGAMLVTNPVPDYRKRRIDDRLRELPSATLSDMQQLQYDVISLQARELLDVFLPHLPAGAVRDRLAAWDCSYSADSFEATLFTRLYRNVLLEIFGQAPGGIGWRRMLYLCSRVGYSIMVLTCIDRLLKNEHSRWWQGRDKAALIRQAAERLDREPEEPWSKVNSFTFLNRFIGEGRIGRALGFHSGDVPMPGCHATPFQGHLLVTAKREATFAPSYHFVTDLGTDEAWTNLPGGASESRFSKYYRNIIPLWRTGEYKRLGIEEASGEELAGDASP